MKYISGINGDSKELLHILIRAHSSRNYDYIKDVLDLNNSVLDNIDDEIVTKRMMVDEYTKTCILDILYTIIEDVVNRSVLIDNILNFCIDNDLFNKSRIRLAGTKDINSTYTQIDVPKRTWRTFKKMCRSRKLEMNGVFKIAIYEFLNNRCINHKRKNRYNQ